MSLLTIPAMSLLGISSSHILTKACQDIDNGSKLFNCSIVYSNVKLEMI